MTKWTKVLPILFGVGLTIAGILASTHNMRADNSDQSKEAGVKILQPWARATPGGVTVGAAYLKITTTDTNGDELIAASSPMADRVELHTHTHEGGVMKMRKVDRLTIAQGKIHTLAPGGDHIMLFDLKKPLESGATLPLTLTFKRAGSVSVTANIMAIGAQSPNSPGDHQAEAGGEGSDRGSGAGHEGH